MKDVRPEISRLFIRAEEFNAPPFMAGKKVLNSEYITYQNNNQSLYGGVVDLKEKVIKQ